MAAHEPHWENSYNRIISMLPMLTKKELDILGDIADEFSAKECIAEEIRPLSENELFERIDHSIAQADAGIGEDADAVIDELMREFSI